MCSKEIRHNESNKEFAKINLPISVLSECKNKDTLLLIATSLFIKAHFGDSILRDISIRNLKQTFSIGQIKASKIHRNITSNNALFTYKPYNNSIVANTFKTRMVYSKNKFGYAMKSMYVVSVNINKGWSLRDIEKHLRNLLYLNAINATERARDKFTNTRSNSKGILFATRESLTLNKMSRIAGVCKSTARRNLYRLENENKISIKKHQITLVSTSTSNECIQELGLAKRNILVNTDNGCVYVMLPNEYNIKDREITNSFKHIIYNHSKRLTLNVNARKLDNLMDCESMSMFN